MTSSKSPEPRTLSWWQVFTSVLASMFGVQSSRKHAQDFTQGRPLPYIVVGLVMTVAFVLTVLLVVKLVLKVAA